MKIFKWNDEKNELLKNNRGISFEVVVCCIQEGKLLSIVEHKNPERYPNQRMYIVEFNNYAYLVPFVETEKEIFLKTIIASRKATKLYLEEKNEKQT